MLGRILQGDYKGGVCVCVSMCSFVYISLYCSFVLEFVGVSLWNELLGLTLHVWVVGTDFLHF